MNPSLQPGLNFVRTLVVEPEMGISHLGEGHSVFSTPAMIWVMEMTAVFCVNPHLEPHEQTVGTMVHVWHRAAASIGTEVSCRASLLEAHKRTLLFEVEVKAGERLLGEGTHQRQIIHIEKFMANTPA